MRVAYNAPCLSLSQWGKTVDAVYALIFSLSLCWSSSIQIHQLSKLDVLVLDTFDFNPSWAWWGMFVLQTQIDPWLLSPKDGWWKRRASRLPYKISWLVCIPYNFSAHFWSPECDRHLQEDCLSCSWQRIQLIQLTGCKMPSGYIKAYVRVHQ